MSKKFDLDRAALNIKVLHGIMYDLTGDADGDNWKEVISRLDVLLDAMEPLVSGLYEYALNGGGAAR